MGGFYPYDDSLEVKRVTEEKVVFEVEGSVAYQSGEYMNERNGTLELEVSKSRAESMAQEILDSS